MTNDIFREKHTLDADGKIAGRLASEVAILLIGKHKVCYQPNADCGDYVEIANIDKMAFSGKKMDKKIYYSASGYPGGLKAKLLSKFYKDDPKRLFKIIVLRMLPKNKLRPEMIKRLIFI